MATFLLFISYCRPCHLLCCQHIPTKEYWGDMKQNKVQLFLHFENKVDSLNPQTKGRKVTTSCQNGGDFLVKFYSQNAKLLLKHFDK